MLEPGQDPALLTEAPPQLGARRARRHDLQGDLPAEVLSFLLGQGGAGGAGLGRDQLPGVGPKQRLDGGAKLRVFATVSETKRSRSLVRIRGPRPARP
jgi:hypothetical protein